MGIVRTDAGAKRFKDPVGSPINVNGSVEQAPKQITALRLLSLHRQVEAAKAAGDDAAAGALQKTFNFALRSFSKGKSPTEVMQLLRGTPPGTK